MKTPVVSIVFPTYNRAQEVKHNITLLRKQLTVPYELFIIDNSDVPSYYKLNENEHHIITGENLGTAARNIGIRKATAPFILMLDDDSAPQQGALEHAIDTLQNTTPSICGVTATVERKDGTLENPPLLPTTFHGCGALFKTDILKQLLPFYPTDFCFYGEEYWSTLKLYQAGYQLQFDSTFKVIHRMSPIGRDVGRILYYLTRNNRKTWKPFIPPQFYDTIIYDTNRRYELIAQKEDVLSSYQKGITEPIQNVQSKPLSLKQFNAITLLDKLKIALQAIPPSTEHITLCGAGKFPTLWAKFIEKNSSAIPVISDFNTGLIGHTYKKFIIHAPEDILQFDNETTTYLYGLSSRCDALHWNTFLQKNNRSNVFNIYEYK